MPPSDPPPERSPKNEEPLELQERVLPVFRQPPRLRPLPLLLAAAAAGLGAAFAYHACSLRETHRTPTGSPQLEDSRPSAPPAAPRVEGPPAISFYHWRTAYDPGPAALKRLAETGRLYLRFFEVGLNDAAFPAPRATVVFRQNPALPVAPVIYLDREVFAEGAAEPQKNLAALLARRVLDIAQFNGLTLVPELHLDCDWTPSTRENFFAFAAEVKKNLPAGWLLAVTLRLDQFRNFRTTGVPPMDKGVLMAYNMGNLTRPGRGDSILDPRIAAQYLKGAPSYPRPLDVALPLFSWTAVFDGRDNFKGLLRIEPPELRRGEFCRSLGEGLFQVKKDFVAPEGWRVPAGWRLRLEEPSGESLAQVADLLAAIAPRRVIFFHLEDGILGKWPAETLAAVAARLAPAGAPDWKRGAP